MKCEISMYSESIYTNEAVVHVFPSTDGWHVKPEHGKETQHSRKALAALIAKQIAANAGDKSGRVIFYREDGSVEAMRTYLATGS